VHIGVPVGRNTSGSFLTFCIRNRPISQGGQLYKRIIIPALRLTVEVLQNLHNIIITFYPTAAHLIHWKYMESYSGIWG